MNRLLCLLFVIAATPLWAQQPSYYTLLDDDLDGADIYGIHQTANGQYWIATDKGILNFDGYGFQNVSCSEMLSSGVFGLCEDYESRLYFHNLSGQVFRISDGECSLHYSIPDSLLTYDISLQIDDQNSLVISAEQTIVVDNGGEAIVFDKNIFGEQEVAGFVREPNSKALLGFNNLDHSIVRFAENSFVKKASESDIDFYNSSLFLVNFRDQLFGFNRESNQLLRFSDNRISLALDVNKVLKSEQIIRCYSTSESMWFATNTFGVLQLDKNLNPVNNGDLLFQDYLISCVYEDSEGNLLMGTFGNGILVIPNLSTQDITSIPKNEHVISIAKNGRDELFFGTRSGRVYKMDNSKNVELFRNKQIKSVELLEPLSDNRLLIGETKGILIDGEIEHELTTGSVKDIAPYSEGSFLLATNQGALILDPDSRTIDNIDELKTRLYNIEFDSLNQTVYAITSKGLALWNQTYGVKYPKVDGNYISAMDIMYQNGRVLIATLNNGLILFQNDSKLKHDPDLFNASDVSIIRKSGDRLYLATSNGIEVYTEDGRLIQVINSSDGLHSENIEDLEIQGNTIWIAYGDGIQSVQWDHLSPFQFTPELRVEAKSGLDFMHLLENGQELDHDENSVQFHLQVQSIKYHREISYSYKLVGADNNWKEQSYSNNVITFQSLSPGTYTFRAIAKCRDHQSEEVSVEFTIDAPYWMTWWFYGAISGALFLIVSLVYYQRLRTQRLNAQRINEINASKLTAIQSQMNPHFIFNALNSIQDLVLKGDISNSYTYITQFANLVRRTLNASDAEFTELSQELKLIELYLGLEQLRFKNDFSFHIDAENVEDVMIPPMLIQPFIENALVHGLLHKEGPKQIDIRFDLADNLKCIITDNGIGRAHASVIKNRRKQSHESFSVKAIKKRFDIFKDHFKGEFGFEYEDLIENGVPAGTKVILTIPIKRVY